MNSFVVLHKEVKVLNSQSKISVIIDIFLILKAKLRYAGIGPAYQVRYLHTRQSPTQSDIYQMMY